MNFDHQISAKAQELVMKLRDQPGEAEYRSLSESFPILLRSAGLLQAVSFLGTKKEDAAHGKLLLHLEAQFLGLRLLKERELLSGKIPSKTRDYMLWTRLMDRAAYWHKRMSQAHLRTAKEIAAASKKGAN